MALVVPWVSNAWSLGFLLDFAGRACCLAVPRKSRCLGLVRASLLCSLIPLALISIPIPFLSLLSAAPSFVTAQILFLIAVRRLAEYVGQPRLASAARSILIAGLCTLAFLIGLSFQARALLRLFPEMGGPGALFFRIPEFATAALSAIYIYIIYKLRTAVVDYDDSRRNRPDTAEHTGRKPASNADIERLLGRYDELS
jgi:hypothetical protein